MTERKQVRDVVLHQPEWFSSESSSTQPDIVKIIFFITGNPGLIGYYEEFLRLLADGSKDAVVVGASLGGFEVSGEESNSELDKSLENDVLFSPTFIRRTLYDLQDQIDLSWKRLLVLVERVKQRSAGKNDKPIEVTLMGHSVGAYIALEMVRKHYEGTCSGDLSFDSFRIKSTILLTPTIQDIAQSSSGKIATPVLSYLPFFPALLQLGSSILTATLPIQWFERLVARVTGIKNTVALNTTIKFLQQPGAVKQALHMARCEMAEIGIAEWKDEIWGTVSNVNEQDSGRVTGPALRWISPKHFFLFAKEDHWVAQSTREAIAKSMNGRAVVQVDDGSLGLVHAWCLEQSSQVTEIVNRWLTEF